ncbi:hypothetical protein [Oceanicaulis alexandrii]|uniref:hypothetical protein n=1 Tax=Oceanicaulis alexandrii TaxID=153233 RepID=UPI002355975D|nr:hypothetical protein [Oceanicaulis alexandrii]
MEEKAPSATPLEYEITTIDKNHNVSSFSCGHRDLDRFLRKDAPKKNKLHKERVKVALNSENRVLGFYSLKLSSVPTQNATSLHKNKTSGYPNNTFPVIELSYLAVDKEYQHGANGNNYRLGEALLIEAVCDSATIIELAAAYAIHLEAIDQNAESFFERYQFERYTKCSRRLMLLPADSALQVKQELEKLP